MDLLTQIRNDIAIARQRLADLEATERVLMAMGQTAPVAQPVVPAQTAPAAPGWPTTQPQPQDGPTLDLVHVAVKDAALAVLKGAKEPWHFSDIAKEAVRRGYKSRNDAKPEQIAHAFRKEMVDYPDLFQKTSRGYFRLVPPKK